MERRRAAVKTLIDRSGFALSKSDWANLRLNDFGLGAFATEGFAFIDLHPSLLLRITLLALLPRQTLPEHMHPPYSSEPGKEETVRVLWGEVRVYVPGEPNNPRIRVPAGKEVCYTSRHELLLRPGDQIRIDPGVMHWFQGGSNGAVALTFQNRVDETRNRFTDPLSAGCPIEPPKPVGKNQRRAGSRTAQPKDSTNTVKECNDPSRDRRVRT